MRSERPILKIAATPVTASPVGRSQLIFTHQYDLEHISQNQKVFTTIIPSMLTYVVLMVVVTLS